MKQSKITLPNGKGEIVVVEVPVNAYGFELIRVIDLVDSDWEISYHFQKGISRFEDAARKSIHTGMPGNINVEILGVIENGKVGFDCESLVESCVLIPVDMSGNKIGKPTDPDWYDYDRAKWFVLNSAEDSFLSLLKSQGIEVENKYGDSEILKRGRPQGWAFNYSNHKSGAEMYDEEKIRYDEEQAKVWEKILVLLKK